MTIQDKKLELIRLISEIQDDKTIDSLSNFVRNNCKLAWSEVSEIEKREIELGLKLLKEGKRVSLEDFLKKVL
jgi:hypothetical protein